jgi:regulatory protein
MADGRRPGDDPAGRSAAVGDRVARLDLITGGGAEPASAPVARLGELLGGGQAGGSGLPDEPEQTARPAIDLGGIDAVDQRAAPVADLAADAQTAPGDVPGPVALFDTGELGAGRADVTVAELGPGAQRGRAARAGRARAGGGRGQGAGRRRTDPRESAEAITTGSERPTDVATHATEAAEPGSAPEGERPQRRGRAGRPGGPRGAARRSGGRQELDPDVDPVAVAREICLRLLTDRARTRQELAQALRRKGVPDEAAHTVLERFDEVGLIDDAAFAGQWVRSRHAHRGLARRAIAVELRRKGVSEEDAGEALAEVDAETEERRARELVERKLRTLAVDTAEQRATAGRRLVGMLARKGYGAGTAYRVVKEALSERGAEVDELGNEEVPDD